MTTVRSSFLKYLTGVVLVAGATGMLNGCAALTHYNHEVDISATKASRGSTNSSTANSKAILMDAKQRAVFAISGKTIVKGEAVDVVRICAEPSPDALSAFAASSSGSLSAESKTALQAAMALSETASNIGLRTQSIQLMRDAMYRVCEGAASGNVSQSQFEMLQRHFQNSMVAILAIEQLTGAVRPGNVQLSTTANLGSAKEIAALTQSAADAKAFADSTAATAAEKKANVSAASAKVTTYLADKGGTETGLTDAQKEELAPLKKAVADAQGEQASANLAATDAQEKLAIYQAGMNAIGGGNLASSGTAVNNGGSGSNTLSGDSATAIANAVTNIVSEQINSGFFREACATLFIAQIDGRASATTLGALPTKCYDYVDKETASITQTRQTYASAEMTVAQAYKSGMDAYANCLATPACAAKGVTPPAAPAASKPPEIEHPLH